MNVRYDVEKMKGIIDDIHAVTGISMAIMDTKFNFLYMVTNEKDLVCIEHNSTAKGRAKCSCSDTAMARLCEKEKRTVSHLCHAGLLDTIVPIMKNETVAGYIIVGRILPTPNAEELAAEHPIEGVSHAELTEKYRAMTYLSDSQMKSFVNLLSHILFENAIEIDYNEFISRATDYIERNLSSDLSVTALCDALFISKNKLYRSFHSFFGCTVGDYITDQRLKRAAELLKSTDKTSAAIAEAVGIPNYTYFSRLFKKHFSLSPAEYRRV